MRGKLLKTFLYYFRLENNELNVYREYMCISYILITEREREQSHASAMHIRPKDKDYCKRSVEFPLLVYGSNSQNS